MNTFLNIFEERGIYPAWVSEKIAEIKSKSLMTRIYERGVKEQYDAKLMAPCYGFGKRLSRSFVFLVSVGGFR